jgi:hypothetical protein
MIISSEILILEHFCGNLPVFCDGFNKNAESFHSPHH